ncbi:glutaredoxin family protein [Dokdonella sp.]|uniref:glutaredoxin family protein n=1 Tax=Dokdonella sp. TaxID=2291710 RepID=UPI002F3F6664
MKASLRVMRGVASTLALVAVAAACGWLGVSVVRGVVAQPALQAGDYSAIVRDAGEPVVLFATTTCPYCRQARALLDAMKVEHVVYDLDVSPPARALYARLHANSVPVLVTRNLRITGFDEAAYRSALGDRMATDTRAR